MAGRSRSALVVLGLALALSLGGVVGYLAGGPYGRDVVHRTLEIQELPIGGMAEPIALDLPALSPTPIRNVVLLIGDGMGLAQIQAARLAAFGPDGRFAFERFPQVGLAETTVVGSPVGESASGATAIATGAQTTHGRVGTAPDGRALRSIVEAARDAGFATGLVTTSSLTDATPAAFAAQVANRKENEEIARQLAESRVDLLVGGGLEWFLPRASRGQRRDRRDLVAEARGRGVTIAANAVELAAAQSAPLWALVPGRPDKSEPEPPLGIWAERALRLLAAESRDRDRGFFLVIEEEGIDTGAHANDLRILTRALLRLDVAVAAAAGYAAADGATLVVVTADHSSGGLSIDYSSEERFVRVAWASAHHAGEPVPVYAYGPADAAARFGGFVHQRELGRRLAELLELDLSVNWKGPS